MELIYAWIEKYRNYKQVELNFSNRFIINYNKTQNKISIEENNSYISIYPKNITNINAIVGKNSVGKTNLMDLLGLKVNDRNRNNDEYELKYKKRKKSKFLQSDEIEAEIKHSIYFFIYYLGKDEDGNNLFCFEGNDIESFEKLLRFESTTHLEINYWKSKYWFAFICNYSSGKLIHKYDLNTRLGNYNVRSEKDGVRYYGDYRSEQDKIAVISLRENLNSKYYDYISTKPEDDYKISVPRRVSKFQSRFLENKIRMLYMQLINSERQMFKDEKYVLKINFNDFLVEDTLDNENKIQLSNSYKNLLGREKYVCKILESFVQFYFKSIINNEKIPDIEKKLSKIKIEDETFFKLSQYYIEIIKCISDNYFKDKEATDHIISCYTHLLNELNVNNEIKFEKDYFWFEIHKDVNIDEIIKVISVTIDEKEYSEYNEMFSVFGRFFNYSIENLSDGESAYLGFYASLFEQITLLTPNKQKYIILLDEPETRMHPELTRNFINDLLLFLLDLSEGKKIFQIIISTHSPFILSDIQSNNILYLEKNEEGNCIPIYRNLRTFGSNIHSLLKDGFFMDSTMGEFATCKIKEVVSFISNTDIEFVTEDKKKECLYIIDSIGEPLIKNRLMKIFNEKISLDSASLYAENMLLRSKLEKCKKSTNVVQSIEILQKQIENLQEVIRKVEIDKDDKN